jgi:hypothetical protein
VPLPGWVIGSCAGSGVCDQETSKVLGTHGRIHGCKWNLLKVREEKYMWKPGSRENMLLFCRCF